jgi:hypothetical protein
MCNSSCVWLLSWRFQSWFQSIVEYELIEIITKIVTHKSNCTLTQLSLNIPYTIRAFHGLPAKHCWDTTRDKSNRTFSALRLHKYNDAYVFHGEHGSYQIGMSKKSAELEYYDREEIPVLIPRVMLWCMTGRKRWAWRHVNYRGKNLLRFCFGYREQWNTTVENYPV